MIFMSNMHVIYQRKIKMADKPHLVSEISGDNNKYHDHHHLTEVACFYGSLPPCCIACCLQASFCPKKVNGSTNRHYDPIWCHFVSYLWALINLLCSVSLLSIMSFFCTLSPNLWYNLYNYLLPDRHICMDSSTTNALFFMTH